MKAWQILLSVAVALVVLVFAYDYNGPNWQSLPASTKLNLMWSEALKNPTPGPWPGVTDSLQLFVFSMATSFDTVADDMPYQGVLSLFRRKKLIHSVGAITQIKWVSRGNHGYSGLFNGCNNAILRFSNAKKPELTEDKPYAPGLSFKFFRTGKKSANFMAMVSLQGVATPNFFLNDMTNHVPDLGPDAPTQLKLVKGVFEKASSWPTMLGLSDFARYTEGGKENTPNFPFRLIFHPTPAARQLFAGVSDASDLPTLLTQKLKSGLNLFEIYAEPSPNAAPIRVGDIVTTSDTISSDFADQYMFFQHQRMEDDFQIHSEWIPGARDIIAKQQATNYFLFPNLPDGGRVDEVDDS